MTSENEELHHIKSAAQAALSHLLSYLEPMCRTLAEEEGPSAESNAKSGPGPDFSNWPQPHFWPQRAHCLMHDTGYLEGLRLKALGALSGDLSGFMQELALCFEAEVRFEAPLKLPFAGHRFQLECKSMNPWRVEAWRVFHGGLLSAYAMQPLHLHWEEPRNPLEALLVVREGEEPSLAKATEIPREVAHGAGNLVTGILNYAALILKEKPVEAPLAEKVGLIQEAARKLALKLSPALTPMPPTGSPPTLR